MTSTASERTVVVTGASSGIGRASALLLAREGFRVFAGVRTRQDGASLRAEGGEAVEPLEIDVTKGATVRAAAEMLTARLAERGLSGLVNNAGIAMTAPVEYVSEESLRRQFDVNVFGQIAVTQAFLPLIRAARGRVVNIGSVGAHLTIPFGGVLCASKAAFSALSDALRLELHPFGIHVSLIEPGAIKTPAVDKTLGSIDGAVDALPPEGIARYGDMMREFMRRAYAREANGSPPEVVARAVLDALTSERPRLRYPVGVHARKLAALPRILPERVLDRVRLRLFGMPTSFGPHAPS